MIVFPPLSLLPNIFHPEKSTNSNIVVIQSGEYYLNIFATHLLWVAYSVHPGNKSKFTLQKYQNLCKKVKGSERIIVVTGSCFIIHQQHP